MSDRQRKRFIGSSMWYVLMGAFLGVLVTVNVSDAMRNKLSWFAIAMLFIMPSIESFWHMRRSARTAAASAKP